MPHGICFWGNRKYRRFICNVFGCGSHCWRADDCKQGVWALGTMGSTWGHVSMQATIPTKTSEIDTTIFGTNQHRTWPWSRPCNGINQKNKMVQDAKEHLLEAKCMQAFYANRDHGQGDIFKVGDKVMLSTLHHQREFTANDPSHVAKFIPCFDGPYDIVNSMPEFSAYTLDLPNSLNIFPTFHSSQLKCFTTNDVSLFPSHEHTWPGPIMTPEGLEEYMIERILDKRHRGCSYQYLVRWVGHGPEDHLLPWHELEECEALNIWINGGGGQG